MFLVLFLNGEWFSWVPSLAVFLLQNFAIAVFLLQNFEWHNELFTSSTVVSYVHLYIKLIH